MGRGVVLSEIGAGQYTVREEIDTATIVTRLAELNSTVASAQAEIVLLQAERANVQIELNIALNSIDASIAAGDVEADLQLRVNAAGRIRAQLDEIDQQINRVSLAVTAAQAQIAELNTYLSINRDRTAWAADLIEGIPVSAVVGLIEPARATRDPLIIQPSRNATDYVYDGARDGILSPAVVAPPNTFFINHVKSPAAIRWRARYRIGTIQTIDTGNDTCSVQMDPVSYNVLNAGIVELLARNEPILTAVPIDYLTCNSAAFIVAARVVVEFDAQGADPMVVGFESNPQPCGPSGCAGQFNVDGPINEALVVRFSEDVSDTWVWSAPVTYWTLDFRTTTPPFGSSLNFTTPQSFFGVEGGTVTVDPTPLIEAEDTLDTPRRVVIDTSNGVADSILIERYIHQFGATPGNVRISMHFNFSRAPDAITGDAPAFSSTLDYQRVDNFGFSPQPRTFDTVGCAPSNGVVFSFQPVVSILSTCTVSLGDGSYGFPIGTLHDRMQFNFPVGGGVDLDTFTGPLTLRGIIEGQELTLNIVESCKNRDGLSRIRNARVDPTNNLLYTVNILSAPSVSTIFVFSNFANPPTSINGAAPAWFDPISTPSFYGYAALEPFIII